jgi:hypothetical protein
MRGMTHSLPRIVAAISSILVLAVVLLGGPSLLAGCYVLQSSAHMTPTVGQFPWDPRGHRCCPNLFHILVLNKKGKWRCIRLNPKSRHVCLWQLVGELLRKGGQVLWLLGPRAKVGVNSTHDTIVWPVWIHSN